MSNPLFKKIILLEILGFFFIMLILWLIEILDLPYHIFGAQPTPINYVECVLETSIILPFSLFIIYISLKMLNEIKHIAMHDPLTDLVNRRFMLEYLNYNIRRNVKSKRMFSFIMCDIDDFKNINDIYGHECGDNVLKQVANILKEATRPQDLTCRWGGEEFLIFLPDISAESTKDIAERLRIAIHTNSFSYNTKTFNFTMSFGISNHFFSQNNFNDFIKEADEKLYEAKKQGKNRIIK